MNGKKIDKNNARCLIAYFSRPGYNYVNGSIVNLPVGNTEVVATMIGDLTGGELFHIEPLNAYPADYTETTEVAKEELRAKARPKLAHRLESIGNYDWIFLGYPNWWGTAPMPVFTFLEECGSAAKTIAPFCTHEGSGLGHSVADIRKACPHSTVLEGLAIRGGDVKDAKDAVSAWLRELGLKT
jgi:flavodoxin